MTPGPREGHVAGGVGGGCWLAADFLPPRSPGSTEPRLRVFPGTPQGATPGVAEHRGRTFVPVWHELVVGGRPVPAVRGSRRPRRNHFGIQPQSGPHPPELAHRHGEVCFKAGAGAEHPRHVLGRHRGAGRVSSQTGQARSRHLRTTETTCLLLEYLRYLQLCCKPSISI